MARSAPPGEPHDWVDWHRPYDDPDSRLARRLAVVQRRLRETLDARSGESTLISMCAGQGRDIVPVLEDHLRRHHVRALLVELDGRNATIAEDGARARGLDRVEVRRADAALTDSYDGYVPADIILACGIFGNISMEDIHRTVRHLPSLAAPSATVLWTRGCFSGKDVTPQIRGWFADSGFEELSFEGPPAETYAVGVNRLIVPPAALVRGVSLFRFFR